MAFKFLNQLAHSLLLCIVLMAGKSVFAMDELDHPLKAVPSRGREGGLPFVVDGTETTTYPMYLSPDIEMSNIQRGTLNFPRAVAIHPYSVTSAPWIGVSLKKAEADGSYTYIIIQDYDGKVLSSMDRLPNSTRPFEIRSHYFFGSHAAGVSNEKYSVEAMVQGTTTFPATFEGSSLNYKGDVHLHPGLGGANTAVSPDNFKLDLPQLGNPGVFWSALKEEGGTKRRVATAHVFLPQAEKNRFVEELRQIRLREGKITRRNIRDYFINVSAEAWAADIYAVLNRFTPPEALKQFLTSKPTPVPAPAPATVPAPMPTLIKAMTRPTSKRTIRKKDSRSMSQRRTTQARKARETRAKSNARQLAKSKALSSRRVRTQAKRTRKATPRMTKRNT